MGHCTSHCAHGPSVPLQVLLLDRRNHKLALFYKDRQFLLHPQPPAPTLVTPVLEGLYGRGREMGLRFRSRVEVDGSEGRLSLTSFGLEMRTSSHGVKPWDVRQVLNGLEWV